MSDASLKAQIDSDIAERKKYINYMMNMFIDI